jgi:HEAT repeat protein
VRAHAAWALGRLGDREGLHARVAAGAESDPAVREELDAALAALAPSTA